jgi:hypothetical protein
LFFALFVVIVVITVIAVQYFTNPQWAIDRHVAAMCALVEAIDDQTDSDASRAAQAALSEHRKALKRLDYLEEVEYFVPIVDNSIERDRLFNALRAFRKRHCVSYWNFEPRPGAGYLVKVTDVPPRQAEWEAIINRRGAPIE